MREHLYRALTDTRGGNEPSEWVYGAVAKFMNISGEIYTAIIPEIDGQNLMCELKRVIPETVCEYTGVTDKNGKKIFEGDIIQVTTKDTSKLRTANIGFGTFADENSVEEEPYIGFYIEFDEIKTTIGQLIGYQNGIGFELDKHYCDIANERIQKALAEKAVGE